MSGPQFQQHALGSEQEAGTDSSTVPPPGPPPNPSTDPRRVAQIDDIFRISPVELVRLLGARLEGLVSTTGDIPPSPPPGSPAISYMQGIEAENQIVGENLQPLNIQHSAITRKFYSRLPPPISVTNYLLRVDYYCPLSNAVYLATASYIRRLAITERAIALTERNVHRLLLAGLRVATKAVEDLSYPHSRFAKVGGVSELELTRLEISFCFLAGFELAVDQNSLSEQWRLLRLGGTAWGVLNQSPSDIYVGMPVGPYRAR